MKRVRLWLALSVAAALLSLTFPATADCEGPSFRLRPRRASPGDELTVIGSGWGDDCNDEGGSWGCDPGPLGDPIQGIDVELRSARTGEVRELGSVDADDDYDFEFTTAIPDLPRGKYFVVDRDDRAPSVPLQIER